MIEITRQHGVTTVAISGRFDFQCITEFKPVLQTDDHRWIVDLSRASYVDSAALGMLLLLRERAGGDSARVTIRGVCGQPQEVLRIARFDRMFTIEAT